MTADPRPSRRRPSARGWLAIGLVLALVAGTTAAAAVATDALGAGQKWESLMRRVDRFLAGPVPDRSAPVTVLVTEPPDAAPSADIAIPTARPSVAIPSGGPGAGSSASAVPATPSPSPTPTATPTPERVPIDVDIAPRDDGLFAHQVHKDWCAVAGVQIVLAMHGLVDISRSTQEEIAGRIRQWESKQDSRNGDWGPAAMSLALDAYGASGYEVRAFETRQGALRDAARAIQATGAPVLLLAWRGAHTWVMTGFRADGDPTIFPKAHIEGAYIFDPWYPWVSSIWGPSDPPGTFQDEAEMIRNFLPWKRPEGHYPDRDGRFITVVPTRPVAPGA